mmetsp:Transcript_32797/g.57099  ORF Transcript_32797/g.57099 Transcript_32797/m.57099 type:complete len:193 (+) Transcript_32797:2497-3075(+)
MDSSLRQSSQQTEFAYQTQKERIVTLAFTVTSKVLKVAIAITILVLISSGDGERCGQEAYDLYITLLVVLLLDISSYLFSLIALHLTPGCMPACYLICYTITKWLLRGAIVSCAIVINVHFFGDYYDCSGAQMSLMIFIMAVLDLLAVVYLLFGCCLTCSCCAAFAGLTNTNYVNERTGSFLAYNADDNSFN